MKKKFLLKIIFKKDSKICIINLLKIFRMFLLIVIRPRILRLLILMERRIRVLDRFCPMLLGRKKKRFLRVCRIVRSFLLNNFFFGKFRYFFTFTFLTFFLNNIFIFFFFTFKIFLIYFCFFFMFEYLETK